MLRLTEITKDYPVAGEYVHALKGVSLSFRKNEFVSILGASGCGKTTLLNIIGGLDKYTSGDLIINGVSTKQFGDKDWDTYRNHSIGFIFQSYHLIPHQTILQNVELALTISGVSKEERRRRAIEALDRVGLKDRIHNKPNQLSGGQAQRVAIARALINDPEIVLADEPTGALDSVTSVQIMDLLKEISKDRLVIMVTHNPELADKYSTRIIRLLDGEVVGDSKPYSEEEEIAETAERAHDSEQPKTNKGKKKRSSMSLGMAFMLSLKNLLSKIKRTTMVAFAGSIGIIGVSLVLAISSGVQGYINKMQDDMLAGNPIVVAESSFDASAIMDGMSISDQKSALKIKKGVINVKGMIEFLYDRGQLMENIFVSNDITKEYIDYIRQMPENYYAAIDYNYGLDLSNNIYTDFQFNGTDSNGESNGGIMSLSAARRVFTSMLERTDFAEYSSYISMLSATFNQMPDDPDFILSQYKMLNDGGYIATKEDEIMIVANDEQELTDLLLAQLGYYTQDEFFNIVYGVTGNDEKYNEELDKKQFSFEELLAKTFTYYPNDTVYTPTSYEGFKSFAQPFTYNAVKGDGEEWTTTGKTLHITGILMLKDGQNYGCLESGFYYTSALSQSIVKAEKENPSKIVQFLNLSKQMLGMDSIIGSEYLKITEPDNEDNVLYEGEAGIIFDYNYEFEGKPYSGRGYVGSQSAMSAIIGTFLNTSVPSYYTLSMRAVGGVDIPNTVNIYALDFKHKDLVTDYLDAWNDGGPIVVNGVTINAEDRSKIVYTDNVGLIISMINTMIRMITIALVAFTALSLVVSTVMIGIITYVSVVERVKEIGILRAVGARKRDVKHLFNAETFIIGFAAGLVGIIITYIISFIINMIVGSLVGIYTIAALPVWQAFIMICVSIGLTLISGLIPASSAAKKDPVVALRTE